MNTLEITIFSIYFILLFSVIFFSYRKQKTDTQYVLGNRGLNYWLTALSAQASDMSNWLFMGYPMKLFLIGIFNIWIALGLVIFMFLNWQLVAPRIRKITEKKNNLTLNTYFESKVGDKTNTIKGISALISLVFYSIYISAGIIGMGLTGEMLFDIDYFWGITLGLILVAFYVFVGGYVTVAWIDLFQGIFLLLIILYVPLQILRQIGGFEPIFAALKAQHLTTSLLGNGSASGYLDIFFITFGWGLGYFGQPHILTKFMGIKNPAEIPKAKYVGISWQILSLVGATLLGMIGVYLFPNGLENPQLIVLEIVKNTLAPVFSSFVLCAIIAATTNVIAAQVLVTASSLGEDFYKGIFFKRASHKQILWASKISVLIICIIGYFLAYFKVGTIYDLVFYAWSGIGSSFGPLLLISLYKNVTKKAAVAGILSGAAIAAFWPYFNQFMDVRIPQLILAFLISSLLILVISKNKGKRISYEKQKTSRINYQ